MKELIIAFLGPGLGAGIMVIAQMLLNRKWQKEDKKEAKKDRTEEIITKLDQLSADVKHVKAANKSILSDRIKWLGTKYLDDGEIEFEDRRNLHDLHDAYHNHCGGNGDYDILMRDIDALPLKRG